MTNKTKFNFRSTLIYLLITIISFSAFSQNNDIQSLYNQATKSLKLFVIKKPLNNAKYDISDSTFYGEYLMHSSEKKVDDKVFLEIIENSKHVDTADWQDTELSGSILIKDSIAPVDLNYVINKFSLNKKLIHTYKRETKRFNRHIADRRYYSMSRPVMDDTHKYAVVNISNNYYGGMLLMFNKEGNIWKELGMIDVWRY